MEEASMDEPEVVQAAEVAPADEAPQEQEIVQAGPKTRFPNLLNLIIALIVAVGAVVGQILLNVLPGDDFGHYKLLVSLSIVAQALMFLGVIWLGIVLAYWGILNSQR
jgi:hypothetical protein